jgi:hypothetical protein
LVAFVAIGCMSMAQGVTVANDGYTSTTTASNSYDGSVKHSPATAVADRHVDPTLGSVGGGNWRSFCALRRVLLPQTPRATHCPRSPRHSKAVPQMSMSIWGSETASLSTPEFSNNVARRAGEHGDRFDLETITSSPVTRGQARSIEQALIVRNPGFENQINSINPSQPYYQQAVDWGNSWLKANGFG